MAAILFTADPDLAIKPRDPDRISRAEMRWETMKSRRRSIPVARVSRARDKEGRDTRASLGQTNLPLCTNAANFSSLLERSSLLLRGRQSQLRVHPLCSFARVNKLWRIFHGVFKNRMKGQWKVLSRCISINDNERIKKCYLRSKRKLWNISFVIKDS